MTTEGMATEDYHGKEEIAWFAVFISEFLVILIINAITITAFARSRHLRKRSTYLIINLTVADLLVGAVTGPLLMLYGAEENHGFEWPGFLSYVFANTFLIAPQVNLCLISLDRLHATLFPFRHCLITKWLYFKIIVGSWFIAILLAVLVAGLLYLNEPHSDGVSYVWASFSILTLLVLIASYVIIILNVQRGPHSQHHGSIHSERKLSVTLLIVTGLSVLTILPFAIHISMPFDVQRELSNKSRVEIRYVLLVIYIASSIANPLVYAIRMQEFRKAIGDFACRRTEPNRVHPLQPHTVQSTEINYTTRF